MNKARQYELNLGLCHWPRSRALFGELFPISWVIGLALCIPLAATKDSRFLIIAFSAGALTFLYKEIRRKDTIRSIADMGEHFDEMILGVIPKDRFAGEKTIPSKQSVLEGFHNVRSNLIFMSVEGHRPRSLLVTSATDGEGKSTIALNLAVIMAQSGSQVLLVDGVSEQGLLHEYFDVPKEPGLSEVLSGKISVQRGIVRTQVTNLDFLPFGASALPNVSASFLPDISPRYDFIVIDSASVFSDAATDSIAAGVEGVLFVVRNNYSDIILSQAALEKLYLRQANILGLVFNGAETDHRETHHFYYSNSDRKEMHDR